MTAAETWMGWLRRRTQQACHTVAVRRFEVPVTEMLICPGEVCSRIGSGMRSVGRGKYRCDNKHCHEFGSVFQVPTVILTRVAVRGNETSECQGSPS